MESLKKYALLAAIGAGVIGALVYFGKQGIAAAGKVAETKLNPYSAENAVYQNVIGGAGRALSGDAGWSLGGWLYDVTHPAKPVAAPVKVSPLKAAVKK